MTEAGGRLDEAAQLEVRNAFRSILEKGAEECPEAPRPPGAKGRTPKSKGRHLLERMEKDIDEILRFMTDERIPFGNNQAERDIRLLKVQQKISGCFRSLAWANDFILLRSFVLTCTRRGLRPLEVLENLFNNKMPSFMSENPQPTHSLSEEAPCQDYPAEKAA